MLAFVFSISRFPGGLGFVQGCKLFRHLVRCYHDSFLPLLSVGVELIERVPSSLGTVCGPGFVLGFFPAVPLRFETAVTRSLLLLLAHRYLILDRNSQKRSEIARDGQRWPEIARDNQRYLEIVRDSLR